jgi:hypothetical protein
VDEQGRLLEVGLPEPCEKGYAGEWLPLKVLLQRPGDADTAVYVKRASCRDADVQLNTDLMQGDLEIRPGEAHVLTVPVCVPTPRLFDLSAVVFQVARRGEVGELVSLPNKPLRIEPAIGDEVKVDLKSLCRYAEGTKAQVTLSHKGRTHFDDFTVTLGPESAVAAGKRVLRRSALAPGDEERFEVVVGGDRLDIDLNGKVDGLAATAQLSRPVPRIATRDARRFRFLEPRRLSLDLTSVTEDGTGRAARPVQAAYPLHGEQRYQIVIRPQQVEVSEVKLHDIPGVIHVLKTEVDAGRRAWSFLVDVTVKGRWSKPERLFYDVHATPQARLTGEIHVRLTPPRLAHATLAATLGLALTIQGLGSLVRFVLKPGFAVEDALSDFHFSSDYQLLFIASIPLAWAALALYDRLHYRWSS